MNNAGKPFGGVTFSDLDHDRPIFDPGGGNPVLAPLYDEIALGERIAGAAALMEYANANVFLNEFMSSLRYLNAAKAMLGELALGEVLIVERIPGTPIIFEH